MQGQRIAVKNTKGLGSIMLYRQPGRVKMPLSPQGGESFTVVEVSESEIAIKLKEGWSRTREEAIENFQALKELRAKQELEELEASKKVAAKKK